MLRMRLALLAFVVPFLVVGCSENPTAGDGHEDELTVELTLTPDHVHTLSEITFKAVIRDGHGDVVMDFDTVRVERLAAGSDTWRTAAELEPAGTGFSGTGEFASSGDYDLRVMALRTGHGEIQAIPMHDTMHPTMGPMHVGRAHTEVGGYRVEFESFPGHIHEGDDVVFKFWVTEVDADASGDRAPITGLTGEIHCVEPDGTSEEHALHESEPGVYEATHTFDGAGAAGAELHFTGAAGTSAEAVFDLDVSHGH